MRGWGRDGGGGDGGMGTGGAAQRVGGQLVESHGSVALSRCLGCSVALIMGWQPSGRGAESRVGWRLGLQFLALYIYYACWIGPNLILCCFGCPMDWALFCCIVFFYIFKNSKHIYVSYCFTKSRITVFVSTGYRYTYPYPCRIASNGAPSNGDL
jgi:hypothetical protein